MVQAASLMQAAHDMILGTIALKSFTLWFKPYAQVSRMMEIERKLPKELINHVPP